METLTQRLERVKDAHWTGEKLNLRQSILFGTQALTGLSHETLNEFFQKRIAPLSGFSPDDLILIGNEHEVRDYLFNEFIPRELEKKEGLMQKLAPPIRRTSISIYELLDQGFEIQFYPADKTATQIEKHTVKLSKGQYQGSAHFTISQKLETILYTIYKAILKQQTKDLL